MRETDGDCDGARAICIAEDDANDDLTEDKTEDATDAGLDESKGVDSEGGGSVKPVLASRLQTGQKVLHEVSQESTQTAWNSANNSLGKNGINIISKSHFNMLIVHNM